MKLARILVAGVKWLLDALAEEVGSAVNTL